MNQELAKIFHEIAVFLDMKKIQFKPRAYEKAADTIDALEEDVSDIYKRGSLEALMKIPGIGESIAKKIEEFIKTGKIKEHQKLFNERPIDLKSLSRVEGLGPKTILKLNQKLGINNLKELEEAAKAGKISKISGLGVKTEQRILKSIEFLKTGGTRLVLGFNMNYFRRILDQIKKVKGVKMAEFAGSVRRMQETVGDLDILVISDHPEEVSNFFISMPEVQDVLAHGPTRSSVRLRIGTEADLRVLPSESFGAAQQYFTGDKYHNVKVRQLAIEKGYKLNEYGLFKGKKAIAALDEKEIYAKLGMAWPEPELRTNRGEIEAALANELPKIIDYGDLKGDLQVQTEWSDGRHSIKEMAKAAQTLGLEYICITDHTKSLTIAGGNDEKKLLEQMKEIDRVNKEFKDFKILKGAEINIMKDGTLDIDDEVLAQLDVAGAAVHSHFNMTEEEMTQRIIRAMENPNVDIIFHPTGRIINRRDAYKLNMDEIFKAAKRTKTVLEIDCFPDRSDLKDEYIKEAVERGIKLSIDTDAHAKEHFQFLEYGVAQARRGWATKDDIINTRPWAEMLKFLKNG